MPSGKRFRRFQSTLRRIRPGKIRVFLIVLALILPILAVTIPSAAYFRELSAAMALSDAEDRITEVVNRVVLEKMDENALDYDYFVTLERNNAGDVTAISTDMARVNKLSGELMRAVVDASNAGDLDLRIPIGSLLGSGLLLGRGPCVPVKITMLTSSRAEFVNELISAGINQTKHQLMLKMSVDICVLLPWEMLNTEVENRLLIAETIIVGDVPETYLNWENSDG